MVFAPALYNSMAYLAVLEKFKNNKINITKIYTSGFSALLIAIYLKEKSLSRAEWTLFKLVRKIKDEKAYSREWKDLVGEFITDQFGDFKLSQIQPELWGVDSKKYTSLKEFLLKQISLHSVGSFSAKIEDVVISSGGVDIDNHYIFSAFPKVLHLKNTNDYLFGNYAKTYSLNINNRTISLENNYKIDDDKSLLKGLSLGKSFQIEQLKD